jgi:general secretion pathway protein N
VLCTIAALGLGAVLGATSSRMDIRPDDVDPGPTEGIEVGMVQPIAKPAQPASAPRPRGNPLWSVPLSALTATQERPIFSITRRPPPPATVASAVVPAHEPQPNPVLEPLQLVLVGAVVGEGDAIAILLDQRDQKVIRLRQGEVHTGWLLNAIEPREVTLKQADRREVLALPGPAVPAAVPVQR